MTCVFIFLRTGDSIIVEYEEYFPSRARILGVVGWVLIAFFNFNSFNSVFEKVTEEQSLTKS